MSALPWGAGACAHSAHRLAELRAVGEEMHQAIKNLFYFLLRRPDTGCSSPRAQANSAQTWVCVCACVLPEPKLPKNQTTLSLALNPLQAEWWLPISVLGGVWKSLNAQFLWPTFQYYITSLIASLPSTPPPTWGCWDFKNPICHLKAYSAPTQFCLPPFRLQFQFKHQVMPSWVGQNPRKP